jgi:hypothetical protein
MEKRETRPRELTDEETKAVSGGAGIIFGNAWGKIEHPANDINNGVGPRPKK